MMVVQEMKVQSNDIFNSSVRLQRKKSTSVEKTAIPWDVFGNLFTS